MNSRLSICHASEPHNKKNTAAGAACLALRANSCLSFFCSAGGGSWPVASFDETDRAFIVAREAIQKWAARCTLSREPEMPAGFHGRTADNWRPLLAIADDLGFGYGDAARAAAVALGSDRQYENPNITLLTDIRTVFDMYGVDRLRTKLDLIPALAGLEDSLWGEWTGLDDTAAPHRLTQGDIGRLLRPFRIRSKTIWPPQRLLLTSMECSSK
jgi:hypothetical protein